MKIRKLRHNLQNRMWVLKKLVRLYKQRDELADAYAVLMNDDDWLITVHNPTYLKNRRQIKFIEKILNKHISLIK